MRRTWTSRYMRRRRWNMKGEGQKENAYISPLWEQIQLMNCRCCCHYSFCHGYDSSPRGDRSLSGILNKPGCIHDSESCDNRIHRLIHWTGKMSANEFLQESFQSTLELSPWLGGWFQIERHRQEESAKANMRSGIHFSLKVTWKYACINSPEVLKECDLFFAEKSCLEADPATFSLFFTHRLPWITLGFIFSLDYLELEFSEPTNMTKTCT